MIPTDDGFDRVARGALSAAQAGDLSAAVVGWTTATRVRPDEPAAWTNLGECLRRLGRFAEAADALERATALAPGLAEAWFCLGTTRKAMGDFAAARTALERAVAVDPGHARGWYNLANLLREDGRFGPAADAYRRAAAVRPGWRDALLNLGATRLQQGDPDDAARVLDGIPRPTLDPEVETSLGDAKAAAGDVPAAATHYRRVAAGTAGWLTRLRADALAEPVPPSDAWIDDYRGRLAATLARCRHESRPLDPATLHRSGAEPPMALAYHGRDDRPLREAWAALFLDRIPDPGPPSPAPGRPRLGVVVTAGHEGVYDRCWGAVADRLAARGTIAVTLVSTRAGANVLRHLRPGFRGDYLEVPDRVDLAAVTIRAARFGVLYYWEVGTDSLNYFLPFFRPAAVQVAGWGWPVTPGHPRIDGFLGSIELDPTDAAAHHTERVAPLPGLPTLYDLPPVPPPADRGALGVPGGRLYLCVQNLRKLLPAFDRLVADLLRTDPGGTAVVVADDRPRVTAAWHRRFAGACPDVAGRVVVVPRRDRAGYLAVVAAAGVVLDPPGYGAGANTAADCAACGVPVVTLPGPFHRGRWQAAVNARLGVPELVATTPEEYVRTAVRVANDRAFRADLGVRISGAAAATFGDDSVVSAVERFFLDAADGATQVLT